MKNALLAKGVRISDCCFSGQQKEITTPTNSFKSEPSEEGLPERSIPYQSPHGYHTEEDLADFIKSHEMEGTL